MSASSSITFADFALAPQLVKALTQQGISTPFPIQRDTLPLALAGKDVVGRGQTGSGKTLAFVLPMLTRLSQLGKSTPGRTRALILSPTRELAMQITDVVKPLAQLLQMNSALICGGMAYSRQIEALQRGADVVIATPGRLADLLESGHASLKHTQIVVVDEADHMADMGFLPEVSALLDRVPRTGQRLLFSATLDQGVGSLVDRYLTQPCHVHSDDAQASVTTMSHHGLLVQFRHKHHVLAQLAAAHERTVVFVRTKRGAEQTAQDLRESGVMAGSLHGDLSQRQRNLALTAFKQGRLPVLVATDVAARGIHVEQVSTVIQADPPNDHKDYLHRAGRTARAGQAGQVITLVLPNQKRTMQNLAEQAGLTLQLQQVRPGDSTLASLGFPAPDYQNHMHPISTEQLEAVLTRVELNREREFSTPRTATANRGGERRRSGGSAGPRHQRRSSGSPAAGNGPSSRATKSRNARAEAPASVRNLTGKAGSRTEASSWNRDSGPASKRRSGNQYAGKAARSDGYRNESSRADADQNRRSSSHTSSRGNAGAGNGRGTQRTDYPSRSTRRGAGKSRFNSKPGASKPGKPRFGKDKVKRG